MRDNPAAGAAPAAAPSVVFAGNPWYGQPRRHAKAAKKGWRKRRRPARRRAAARRRPARRRCPPCRYKRDPRGRFKGGIARREQLALLENPGILDNPPALLDNQVSPFTARGLMMYGTAAAAAAFGLLIADFVDRLVATRKPKDGKHPWYGRDAAAAINRRPDAMRLGAQAVGGVAGLGLAYWLRGRGPAILPWIFGGIALGFGSNLLLKLANWYLMPAIFKVKEDNEVSFANRMYALEQDKVQKEIDKAFENYATVPTLSEGQTETPTIQSPLADPVAGPLVQLGAAAGKAEADVNAGAVGSGQAPRVLLQTGRLGDCPSCGGHDACYSDCETLCPKCDGYRPYQECSYQVEDGDDLAALAAQAGVSIDAVNAMNGSTPDRYWMVGNTVRLPYGMCMVVEKKGLTSLPPTHVPTAAVAFAESLAPATVTTEMLTPAPELVAGVATAAGPLAGQPHGNGNGPKSIPARPAWRPTPIGTVGDWEEDAR